MDLFDQIQFPNSIEAIALGPEGDPAEEDAVPEESIPPNGFAYDPERGLLYLQCFYIWGQR
jgi:hypothetical protein